LSFFYAGTGLARVARLVARHEAASRRSMKEFNIYRPAKFIDWRTADVYRHPPSQSHHH
jgi:hypothetical protein